MIINELKFLIKYIKKIKFYCFKYNNNISFFLTRIFISINSNNISYNIIYYH